MEKKKILVVDDELDFLEMVKMRLEANDYEVVTASNGKQAIEKAERERLDAVLLDILMPGFNGLEVLKKIRSKNKNLPVFIITALSDKERFKLARKLDSSGFIIKTEDLKKSMEAIDAALRLSDKHKKV